MEHLIVYIHGKGGSADEAEHYRELFPEHDVVGLDYSSQTPWGAKAEFAAVFSELRGKYKEVVLIANSIGAYFSMHALSEEYISRAYFISPIADMEQLILDMLKRAGAGEDELREKGEIQTSFGEVLSWDYLEYVRDDPIAWRVPTEILYGENDSLTSYETVVRFAEKINAGLTVMPHGEHWFHTAGQMRFLDEWIKKLLYT